MFVLGNLYGIVNKRFDLNIYPVYDLEARTSFCESSTLTIAGISRLFARIRNNQPPPPTTTTATTVCLCLQINRSSIEYKRLV